MEMPAQSRLGLDIKRTEQVLMSAKANALKSVGLTVAQYAALIVLQDNPGISAAALARACLVTPQAMTSVLRALEERGLLERTAHPLHQHVRETRLTESGRATATAGDEEAVRIERRIADEFTAEGRDKLRELLARCVSAIQDTPNSTTVLIDCRQLQVPFEWPPIRRPFHGDLRVCGGTRDDRRSCGSRLAESL